MSTQFTSASLRRVLSGATLACSLAIASFAAHAETDSGGGLTVGRVIAIQGNAAVREIREDARRSVRRSRPASIAPLDEFLAVELPSATESGSSATEGSAPCSALWLQYASDLSSAVLGPSRGMQAYSKQ